MILADTSVWVEHLRRGEAALERLLDAGEILCHPLIVGEIAMGSVKNRSAVLGALQKLPEPELASDGEVLKLVGEHPLFGVGIGYIDAHLITSVRLTPDCLLWTRDRRLHLAAVSLSLEYTHL